MSCLIKNIPSEAFLITGTGNRGHGYPTFLDCGDVAQPVIEDCYLALEIDPVGSPILLEAAGPGPYLTEPDIAFTMSAPCVSAYEVECYIALQENGYTPLEVQDTTDTFYAPCIV